MRWGSLVPANIDYIARFIVEIERAAFLGGGHEEPFAHGWLVPRGRVDVVVGAC